MEQAELNGRCIELFERPRVRNHMWHARMFWELGKAHAYTRDDLIRPKVDLCELEVLLSAAAYEASQCAETLNAREPGRADFIRRAVRSGQRPLLHHADNR